GRPRGGFRPEALQKRLEHQLVVEQLKAVLFVKHTRTDVGRLGRLVERVDARGSLPLLGAGRGRKDRRVLVVDRGVRGLGRDGDQKVRLTYQVSVQRLHIGAGKARTDDDRGGFTSLHGGDTTNHRRDGFYRHSMLV